MVPEDTHAVAGRAEPVLDTAALGLVPGTPVVSVTAFDAPPGHRPPETLDLHRLIIFTGPAPVDVVVRRDGARRDVTVRRGDMALVPAGTRAGFAWAGRVRGIGVLVDPATVQDFARREMKVLVTGLDHDGPHPLRDEALLAAAEAMRDAVLPEGPGREMIFDSMARVFLATLIRRHGVFADGAGAAFGDGRWRALVDHVGARLSGHLTPAEMARAVGMSESRFRRALREATGLAPAAWLRRERVLRAREMLGRGDALGEIAVRCGFADQAHLTRSFKSAFGLTPTAWRRGRG
ncbi:MAG: helix-turn-helix transcriptional regulator [Hasllibacter sp.]